MKITTLQAALGSAALLLTAQPTVASHSHEHMHAQFKKHLNHLHGHGHAHTHETRETHDLIDAPRSSEKVEKRGTCSLPHHDDLHFVPGAENAGFAMSPDQPCKHGSYCPIACKAGKVMAQWKPNSAYVYPESMVSVWCVTR